MEIKLNSEWTSPYSCIENFAYSHSNIAMEFEQSDAAQLASIIAETIPIYNSIRPQMMLETQRSLKS